MTDKELREIRKRLKTITPPPWMMIPDIRPDVVQAEIWTVRRRGGYADEGQLVRRVHASYGHIAEFSKNYGNKRGVMSAIDDADFIAHAPSDIYALLSEVDKLRRIVKILKK